MESPTPVSRYIASSKKRVFPAGSSSSAYKDAEVLEISPPANRTSMPPMSSKQKEVIHNEIIDVDMDDDPEEIMLTDGEFDPSGKGKEVLHHTFAEFNSLLTGESDSNIPMPNYGVAGLHDSTYVDDYSPDLFYEEDEWIDTYYEDILFDDYTVLESQFDHMDIPPGVEAPFPWFPSSPGSDSKALPSSAPSSTGSLLHMDTADHASNPYCPQPSFPLKHIQIGNQSTPRIKSVGSTQLNVDRQHAKEKLLTSIWKEHSMGLKNPPTSSSTSNSFSQYSKAPFPHKHGKDVLQSLSKIKKKSRAFHPILYNQPPPYVSNISSPNSHPPLSIPTTAPGQGNYMPVWKDPLNMFEPLLGSSEVYPGGQFSSWTPDPAIDQKGAPPMDTSLTLTVEPRNMDQILQNFDSFKKFDTVEDYDDHHFSKNGSSAKLAPKTWAKRIHEEWKILQKDLPDKIFVRVYESRMDLLRAVIVGADGTPYHDGLYFFDVFFPTSYPNIPPHVYYHSGGLRINPNLYNCGKVCLSLLNTWSGSQKEKWLPGTSTMLQVLVSIQGLILNAQPYFNEPGYATLSGSARGEERSFDYNEKTFMHSLQTMVYSMRRPPKHFEDFVIGHFCKNARDILVSCKAYLEGAQVGCLVKGSDIQDVNEGDKSSSHRFRSNLARFIPVLVNTFSQIGAQGCEEFLSLASKANVPAPATAPAPAPANASWVTPNFPLNY
ncbi:probable ubiquitin-conjugating enzyme E2 25 [Andrographis paniculata]|uniref:probable ubiquitin-conjugating enzyme E2 25 n=1 Tax=Andrographis paniculata TaxID=175694 RepID=UPI0021E910BC|nr:probable ubiquitin-conjugating enzyme E2 25 [Andrographis paniculata]